MKPILAAAAFGLLSIAPASALAVPDTHMMEAFLEQDVRAWANDPVLVNTIMAQNTETGDFTQADIDAADTQWRDTVHSTGSELTFAVLNNAASDFLRARVGQSYGLITEVFVMDARGLNVAASQPTSDYWQGDEAKFLETFLVSPEVVQFSDIEFDESTQTNQVQMSFTITDPATGEAIGATTIGVTADML